MMDEDDMLGMISGYSGRMDYSEPAVKRIRDKIEQNEKSAKMAKVIFDMLNGKLKEVRQLGDYRIYNQVISALKAMDSRIRDANFAIAEDKATLETMMEARTRYENVGAVATMRARKKQMKGLKKFTTIKGFGLYKGGKRLR
jgi:hypothetical protein